MNYIKPRHLLEGWSFSRAQLGDNSQIDYDRVEARWRQDGCVVRSKKSPAAIHS